MKKILFLLLICSTAMAQKKDAVNDSILVLKPAIGSITKTDTIECWFKFVVVQDNNPIELWQQGYAVIPYRIQRVPNFSMFLIQEEKGEPTMFLWENKHPYIGKVLYWIEK